MVCSARAKVALEIAITGFLPLEIYQHYTGEVVVKQGLSRKSGINKCKFVYY